MNLILTGFMGAGKTSVAKHLSRLLGFSHIEMDDLVYQKTHTRNMHEVFAMGGETLLRKTEIAIAKEYASKTDLVISAGGGAILTKIIYDYFKKGRGKVIFLNAGFEQIAKRLDGDRSRPLFANLTDAKKLYDFRLPLYISYADEIIDADFDPAEKIALQIKKRLF